MVYCILAGILLGAIITLILVRMFSDGDLVVYIPDYPDEPPYLSSEWNKPIGQVLNKKRVTLKVVIRHLNSQK